MKRSDINPWEWSKAFGYSQAVQTSDYKQVLFCSGQTATGPDGAPPTTSDMTEQVATAFANLCSVLEPSSNDTHRCESSRLPGTKGGDRGNRSTLARLLDEPFRRHDYSAHADDSAQILRIEIVLGPLLGRSPFLS